MGEGSGWRGADRGGNVLWPVGMAAEGRSSSQLPSLGMSTERASERRSMSVVGPSRQWSCASTRVIGWNSEKPKKERTNFFGVPDLCPVDCAQGVDLRHADAGCSLRASPPVLENG